MIRGNTCVLLLSNSLYLSLNNSHLKDVTICNNILSNFFHISIRPDRSLLIGWQTSKWISGMLSSMIITLYSKINIYSSYLFIPPCFSVTLNIRAVSQTRQKKYQFKIGFNTRKYDFTFIWITKIKDHNNIFKRFIFIRSIVLKIISEIRIQKFDLLWTLGSIPYM